MFKNTEEKSKFEKILNSEKLYLEQAKIKNLQELEKNYRNYYKAEMIYNLINYFIEGKLEKIKMLENKDFYSKVEAKLVSRIMKKKLLITINYANLLKYKNINQIPIYSFAIFYYRKSFCNDLLVEYASPYPTCGLTNQDYTSLIIGSEDSTIKVINLLDYSLKCTLKGHKASVTSLFLYNSENFLVSCSDDYSIKLWNLSNKTLLQSIEVHEFPIESSTINLENNRFATADQSGKIFIWNLNNWECLQQYHVFFYYYLSIRFVGPESVVVSSDFSLIQVFGNYKSTLMTVKKLIIFFEISFSQAFAVFSTRGWEINQFEFESNTKKLIREEDSNEHFVDFKLVTENTLIVLRKTNFIIIDLLNNTERFINCFFLNVKILYSPGHSAFMIINDYYRAKIYNINNIENYKETKKQLNAYDFQYLVKDKLRGFLHMLDSQCYKIFNLKTKEFTEIINESFTSLTGDQIENIFYLGDRFGDIYSINYGNNQTRVKVFSYYHFLNEINNKYLSTENNSQQSEQRLSYIEDYIFQKLSNNINFSDFPHDVSPIFLLKVSESKKFLGVSIKNNHEIIFDINKRKVVNLFKMHNCKIIHCAFSGKDNYYASVSRNLCIFIYDLKRNLVIIQKSTKSPIKGIKFLKENILKVFFLGNVVEDIVFNI